MHYDCWKIILIKLTKVLRQKKRHFLEFGRWNLSCDTKANKKNASRFVLWMCKSTATLKQCENLYEFFCLPLWYVSLHSFKTIFWKKEEFNDECHHVTATCASFLLFLSFFHWLCIKLISLKFYLDMVCDLIIGLGHGCACVCVFVW